MANIKISELTAATTLAATDELEINAAGVSKKATAQNILDLAASATQTLTNKTLDTAGTGNVLKINGTAVSDKTGTGKVVLDTSPVLTTPNIGSATGASLSVTATMRMLSATAPPAGGTTGYGYKLGSGANFGVFYGSGAPTLTGDQGALYLRSDGVPYYNTNGSTGWTQLFPSSGGTISGAITYGGVTLSNSVTGTGSMVLSTSPQFSTGIGIGTAAATATLSTNAGNLSGATTAYGTSTTPVIQSGVTSAYYGYYSAGNTQAAAFTLGSARHFQTNGVTLGAGSTISNQYGFLVESTMTQATNNFGFYGALASSTGVWNLYMAGDASNYMAGSLGIGSTALTGFTLKTAKNVTGSTSYFNVAAQGAIQSDVTTNYYGFYSGPSTQATAFTLTNAFHYRVDPVTIGAGSAVTTQYGFMVPSGMTTATTNYGFYHNLASATGVWGFYGAGTAANYFGGATTFNAALTYGGVTLSNSVTGTGSMVLSTAPTFTNAVNFNGSSSTLAAVLANAAETTTISATAATGTINYDIATQAVVYYTTNASANWTVNFRGSSGTSLNTAMATGQSVTVAFLVTQGATAYYNSAVQVDGSSVTPKWQGGTAPTAGNASGIDVYTYTIIKTGSAAFTVLASQTQFK